MFGSGDPFGQQDQGQDYAGDRLVGRIMSEELNLSIQQRQPMQASRILGQMLGQFLADRFSR